MTLTSALVPIGETSGSSRKQESIQATLKSTRPPVDQGIHEFKPPASSDLRSVCPALNTLANHSYLPHNGKDITASKLVSALHAGYGISPGFAKFLVRGSYILLGRNPLSNLDLHLIDKHDEHFGIEHNASVAHDDADGRTYAPKHVDSDLLQEFLNKAHTPLDLRSSEGDDITYTDVAYTRIAREAASGPINSLHQEIARGEFAMVLDIFGKGKEKALSKQEMEVWVKDNRFPAGWAPNHEETLSETIAMSGKIRARMNDLRGVGKEEHWATFLKTLEGLLEKVESKVDPHKLLEIVSDRKFGVDEGSGKLSGIMGWDKGLIISFFLVFSCLVSAMQYLGSWRMVL